jgi:hypothetical protein
MMKKILNNYYQDATYMTVDEFLKLDEPSETSLTEQETVSLMEDASLLNRLTSKPMSSLKIRIDPLWDLYSAIDPPLTRYQLTTTDIKTNFVDDDLKSVQIYFNAESPESSEIFEFSATFCQEPFQNSFGHLVKLYIQSQSDGLYKQHRSLSTVNFLADLVFTATGPYAGFAFRNFELILP